MTSVTANRIILKRNEVYMKCANCGKTISETDVFCPHCGERVANIGKEDPWHRYRSPESVHQQMMPSAKAGSGNRIVVIILIILLLLLLVFAGAFFLRYKTPELDAMTYDELITDYSLSSDNSDKVKAAYNDCVRIEFEDVSKSSSGYKATAIVYTPDMEEVYEKTTEESSVIDRLGRLSDQDLEKSTRAVRIDRKNKEMTSDSAEDLKNAIDKKYMTAEVYNAEKQVSESAAVPAEDSPSADSGSTTNNTYNNYTYNVESVPPETQESDSSTTAGIPSASNSGYVIADSSSRYISESELSGLSKWQCCIARNEIYARHGRMFVRDDLQSYFNNCTWYTPTVAASSFNESVLNSYERKNIQTIKSYEKAHGYI